MTTIPQRLREIAELIRNPHPVGRPWVSSFEVTQGIEAIAAALEAPAADAVPVVALLTDGCESGAIRADRAEGWHALVHSTDPLIRQRDHIATVAALQDRINELESRQEQVRAFLDIAAGEGMELGGVDAGDLYVRLFGHPILDESKE